MNSLAPLVSLALAILVVTAGLVSIFTSANALKKVAAVLTALVGAGLVLAFMEGPPVALALTGAIMLGYALAGVAIAVRLQEAYGSAEHSKIDSLDEQDEPQEPAA